MNIYIKEKLKLGHTFKLLLITFDVFRTMALYARNNAVAFKDQVFEGTREKESYDKYQDRLYSWPSDLQVYFHDSDYFCISPK